jgi:Outer membrane protein beta-barrel domain
MKRIVPVVRATVLALLITSFSQQSFSQSITAGNGKVEVGLGLGPLIFLGDLGGSQGLGKTFVKDIDFPLTKLSKGLFLNVTANEWLGFRLAVNAGVLEGDDKEAPDKGGEEEYRLKRNLNFKSSLLEGYAAVEFYPTVFIEQYDGLAGKLRPYGVIGAGMYHFNPKTKDDDGTWVALQPLHTEGEGFTAYPDRKPYKLTQIEMPIGVGFKYYLKENMFIGLEVLHRKLFTDYVDDVSTKYIDPVYFDAYLSPADAAKARRLNYRGTFASVNTNPGSIVGETRGDPKQNDAFFSTIIRMGWRLNGSNTPNGRAAHQLRCPKFY